MDCRCRHNASKEKMNAEYVLVYELNGICISLFLEQCQYCVLVLPLTLSIYLLLETSQHKTSLKDYLFLYSQSQDNQVTTPTNIYCINYSIINDYCSNMGIKKYSYKHRPKKS